MKTISGKIISSKPISLSKAARVLSTFVSAETGASQAVSAYLRRTSTAFNELTQLHKELKASRSERKRNKHRLDTIAIEIPNEDVENSGGLLFGEREVEASIEVEQEKRKKRKSVEVESSERDDSEARRSKKKKRRRSEGDE